MVNDTRMYKMTKIKLIKSVINWINFIFGHFKFRPVMDLKIFCLLYFLSKLLFVALYA